MKITLEKQKSWTEENLREKIDTLGVEGFTITDLPLSSVIQAYWFLLAFFANLIFGKFAWFQDTDTYFFYKNTMGKKNKSDFWNIFLKLHKKLLDHEDTFEAIKYTPNAIVSVAANGRFKKILRTSINRITKRQILGLFIVSGGGILQRIFKSFPFSSLFLNSSLDLISETRKKYPNLKIFAAWNPNLSSDNMHRFLLKSKNVNTFLTQPPFIWTKFEKYLNEIQTNSELSKVELRMGVPIFTSPWNVRFWMRLVQINWRKEKEVEDLLRLFEQKYNQDKTEKKIEFKEFSKNWTIDFINKIQKLQEKFPQITGIHIMPMGNYIPVEEIIKAIKK